MVNLRWPIEETLGDNWETCEVARDRLSRTLFPWTITTAIVEEACFEVNKSFYFREKIILQ